MKTPNQNLVRDRASSIKSQSLLNIVALRCENAEKDLGFLLSELRSCKSIQSEEIKALKALANHQKAKSSAGTVCILDCSSERSVGVWITGSTWTTFEWLTQGRKLLEKVDTRSRQSLVVELIEQGNNGAEFFSSAVDSLVAAAEAKKFKAQTYAKKKKGDDDKDKHLELFVVTPDSKTVEVLNKIAERSARMAEATNFVRKLALLPANKLDCKEYVELCKTEAKKHKLEFEFLDAKKLKKLGAGSFLAVAQGSAHEDYGIVRLSYLPSGAKKSKKSLALVGKGVVYDTGGVCLKPASAMFGMHGDMTGSAIALGLVRLAAAEKWSFPVDAYLAISDNSIGSRAFRPNEVVHAANGLSIETVHTDAEGRMMLADTLYLASKNKPDLVLDFATLTGSAIRAIGTNYSAVFTNKPEWNQELIQAGVKSGERVWPFPLDEDFGECLKSEIADTKQCRLSGGADHIEAAIFMKKFLAQESTPWVHVDLSAAEHEGGLGAVAGKDTGFGVRFACEWIRQRFGGL